MMYSYSEENTRRSSRIYSEKSEDLDQLQSWHKKLSDAGFSVDILQLTSNYPLEDFEPVAQSPDRVLVFSLTFG